MEERRRRSVLDGDGGATLASGLRRNHPRRPARRTNAPRPRSPLRSSTTRRKPIIAVWVFEVNCRRPGENFFPLC